MQDIEKKKKMVLKALADTLKELRGEESLFMVSSENDISISIMSTAERGIKDPQLTTLFRLAEAYNLNIVEFISKILSKLPENFSMIER